MRKDRQWTIEPNVTNIHIDNDTAAVKTHGLGVMVKTPKDKSNAEIRLIQVHRQLVHRQQARHGLHDSPARHGLLP